MQPEVEPWHLLRHGMRVQIATGKLAGITARVDRLDVPPHRRAHRMDMGYVVLETIPASNSYAYEYGYKPGDTKRIYLHRLLPFAETSHENW